MKKLMIAASAAALLATSSLAALADEITGSITSIDVMAGTLTLDDGQTYKLPAETDAAALQVGEQVTIEFEAEANGELMATSVEPAA
jgi:hypothetical protein